MKKIILSSLVAATLVSTITPTISAVAAEENSTHNLVINEDLKVENDVYNPYTELPSAEELADLGLTDEQLNGINEVTYSGIMVESAPSKPGEFTTFGKLSASVKVIRAGWKKLPAKVRNYIAGFVGVDTFLSYVETLTGNIENALYKACRHFGMNTSWSTFLSKTIVFVLL